jgi:hypothetical protein
MTRPFGSSVSRPSKGLSAKFLERSIRRATNRDALSGLSRLTKARICARSRCAGRVKRTFMHASAGGTVRRFLPLKQNRPDARHPCLPAPPFVPGPTGDICHYAVTQSPGRLRRVPPDPLLARISPAPTVFSFQGSCSHTYHNACTPVICKAVGHITRPSQAPAAGAQNWRLGRRSPSRRGRRPSSGDRSRAVRRPLT